MDNDYEDGGCFRYGTPLDPFDEDDVPKKKSTFQDITEQYALDANGKRRFHGAFTGGFTAGHGNSVALPEGWTPQAFKSSRSERMQLKQKPEDFMDDEDRGEFGIAPRQVHTTKDFTGSKRTKQRKFLDGPIPGEPVLQSLLEAVHDTVAIRILKKMGWRPGLGIGERITAREKKSARKKYTCHIPQEFRDISDGIEDTSKYSDSESSDENEFSDILFEPDDFEPYVAKPKTDSFGLGYSGLSRHSVLGPQKIFDRHDNEWRGSHLVTNDKGKNVNIRGQAFGVGALEEDDDDIYAKDDMSHYDFALDHPSKVKPSKDTKAAVAPSNRNILEGFVASSTEYKPVKIYPAPALPHGYAPSACTARKTRFSNATETSDAEVIRDRGLGRHDLTADQRGNILGERENTNQRQQSTAQIINKSEPESNAVKGTNNNLSYEERIAAITGRNINFTSTADQTQETKETPANQADESTPYVFKPFSLNPEKQLRYEKFVSCKQKQNKSADNAQQQNDYLSEITDVLSSWEREKELSEFEQAFKLYKPLTGFMNDKFVSGSRDENSTLEVPKSSFSYVCSKKQEAARLGMFGKLTRETIEWRPEPLLCRRFNIAEPFSEGPIPQNTDKKKLSYSIFEHLDKPVHDKDSYFKEQMKSVPNKANINQNAILPTSKSVAIPTPNEIKIINKENSKVTPLKSKRLTVAELFLQEKEKEKQSADVNKPVENLEFQRELSKPSIEEAPVKETIDNFNKIDLYKAIFLSDSESETSADEGKSSETTTENKIIFEPTPKNIERNPSPPKGIFANLNFDKMNSWRTNTEQENPSQSTSSANKAVVIEDAYGPKLPEKPLSTPTIDKSVSSEATNVMELSSDSSDWVETDKVKNKKSKSKHKKSKKSNKKKKDSGSLKHHKHKHKSKSKRDK